MPTIDTGAIGYVPTEYPRPLPASKGKGRVAVMPGRMAYYQGETPGDAEAFAAELRASFASFLAREAGRPAPPRVTVKVKGDPMAQHRSAFDPSGLISHTCEAAKSHGGRVRSRYMINDHCPACWGDRQPVTLRDCVICHGEKDAPVHNPTGRNLHSMYGATPHDYVGPELPYAVPTVGLDAGRWIPADLYTPANHQRRPDKPPTAKSSPVKTARPVRARAVKAEPVKVAPPEPAPSLAKTARHHRPDPCPRCGQTFRFDGGRAWHLANRPHCKAESAKRHRAA